MLLIVVTVTVISVSPLFGVVFATDTNYIVQFFVVNTTNTDSEKIFQKLSTDEKAEQSVEPEPRKTRFQYSTSTARGPVNAVVHRA